MTYLWSQIYSEINLVGNLGGSCFSSLKIGSKDSMRIVFIQQSRRVHVNACVERRTANYSLYHLPKSNTFCLWVKCCYCMCSNLQPAFHLRLFLQRLITVKFKSLHDVNSPALLWLYLHTWFMLPLRFEALWMSASKPLFVSLDVSRTSLNNVFFVSQQAHLFVCLSEVTEQVTR